MIRVLIGPRGGSLVLTGFCVEVSCIREVVLGALHFCLVVSLMYSTLHMSLFLRVPCALKPRQIILTKLFYQIQPLYSCKSLSASSAESATGSDIGSAIGSSTVGSAVSTSVSSIVKSAHSDPSDQSKFQKNKHSSPWRRVMNRMNQSLGMGRGGSGNAGGSGGGSGNGAGKGGFRRSLSGRENPARPNLSEDEGGNSPVSPVNELPVVVGLPNDMLQLSLGGITAGVGENLTAKSAGGSKSSGSETRKTGSKKGTKKKKSRSSTVSASVATKDNHEEEKKIASKAPLKSSTAETHFDDPGVELDLSDSEDEDEISINDSGRIIGNRIPLHEGNVIEAQKQQTSSTSRPSSVELPHPPSMGESTSCDYGGVEAFLHNRPLSSISHVATAGTVMEEMTFGSVQIISPSFEENSPPTVERCMVAVDEGDENDVHFPYHPLGGRNDEGIEASNAQQGANYAVDASSTIPMRLKYRSPQRSLPPSSATPSPQHRTSNNSNNEHSPSASSHDSPDSRLSSSAGSPTSRISSSSTRTGGADSGASISCATTLSGGDRTINTLQTEGSLVVDGMDYEVREANRRSFSMRGRSNIGSGIGDVGNRHEAIGSPSDGNETVFSSSTTSSNYHSYLQSPRPLREGATMPVERFFAGGNVAMSPMAREVYPVGESSTASLMSMAGAPNIISLSPKKISRISAGSGSSSSGNHSHRDAAHSPHTVSSHSVSANSSSSGSEALMKKPLKFVAYANREERESPFDEPPIASGISSINRGHHTASLIKPRISKVGTNPQQRHRPPMIQHRASATPYNNNNPQSSNTKPPQSPRKQDVAYALRLSGARTPTRTPPPSSYRDMLQSSGANTPCSPPVIVDGPTNVLCGDLSMKPKRPCVVRRSSAPVGASGGRGMILIPPSGASYRSHLTHPHIPPRPTPASSMSSPSRDNLTVMTTGIGVNDADDGAQEIVLTSTTSGVSTSSMEGGATASTLISPDNRQSLLYGNTGRRLHNLDNATEKKTDHVGRNVGSAIVSPEKGL